MAHLPMTFKQRMLAALRGEPTDCLPWAPRLDLWYNAHQRAGTLPAGYSHDSLRDFVEEMGVGYHAVIPPFRDLRGPEDDIDRGLGLFNLHMMPYRTVLEGVERTVCREGDLTRVEYRTPVGTLSTAVLYDESMRKAGISISHIAEHAIKDAGDMETLGYLFEHARVEPRYAGYTAFAEEVGDLGLAVGFVSLAASPMQLIQRELIPYDRFFLALYDYPEELERLVERIGVYWQRVMDVVIDCPAEVLLVGGNYDATVTYPPFFAEHILPWLQRYTTALHQRGKYLLTHTDGENTGLLEHYLAAEIDIADSICPAPMTKLTFKEVRDVFAGRISIMGGIPSVALLQSSMSNDEFTRFLDDFFTQIDAGDHLILGISDTTPPDAEFSRLLEIGRRVETFEMGKMTCTNI